MTCPMCRSSNIKKVSLVYEEGRSTVDLNTTSTGAGVGISSSGLGVGVAKSKGSTTGVQQTDLSKRAAPHLLRCLANPTISASPATPPKASASF